MKKFIICILIVLLICNAAITVCAFGDSDAVPPNVVNAIQPETEDTLIRFYNVAIENLALEKTYDDVLSRAIQHNFFYYYHIHGETVDLKGVNDAGTVYKISSTDMANAVPAVRQYLSQKAIKTVSDEIKVWNIYLLGRSYDADRAIYYKTNMGNYVFFAVDGVECLFAADIFYEFINSVFGRRQIGEVTQTADYDTEAIEKIDLSPYDYRSADFNPHAPLREKTSPYLIWGCIGGGMAVLAAAAVTTVLIIRKKKKTTVQEEMEPTPEET